MVRSIAAVLISTFCFISPGWADEPQLGLRQAIDDAMVNDLWLKGSEFNEKALLAESVVAGELPDPKLSVGLENLATDTLEFDQEPMTQFKVGIAQTFPRGDTRKLMRKQKQQQSAAYPFLREDHKAALALKISLLWLDGFLAQNSVALIEQNRRLFDQLVDITYANYTTTSGSTRQQDVIRAELELTRLNDRLTALWQRRDAARQALREWLSPELTGRDFPAVLPDTFSTTLADLWSENLATLSLSIDPMADKRQALRQLIQRHPRLQSIDQKIRAEDTGVDLVRQQYKPEWGINAGYAYRDDDPLGRDRADFMSLGITVDLPLFTANRQDQRVLAAIHRRAAFQTEHDMVFREILAAYEKAQVELQRLEERERLYQDYLLPQMHDQADATLAAYTSDGGDFAEVMRAHIAELNTKIMALELTVKRQKMLAKINYFVAGARINDVLVDKTMEEK